MKHARLFGTLLSFSFLTACGGGMQTSSPETPSTTDTTQTQVYEDNSQVPATVQKPECDITGKVLETNQLWSREHGLIAAIVADEETRDENYGDSHRILEIYDANTCQRIDRQILPVNVSPDFPYYLAKINYNNTIQMLAIRGFDRVFLYDLANRKLLPAMEPVFKGDRYAEDAQSGMIHRLELWENYLVGAAEDMGVFVFDLTDRQNPKAMMPFAEHEITEDDFGSLFLVASAGNGQQIIMPSYDINNNEFSINPLFDSPKALNTANISASARNNRFLVIREANEARTPVAIDLQARRLVELPANVAGQSTQQILAWMRENS